jgi:tellurite resistance protein TerB
MPVSRCERSRKAGSCSHDCAKQAVAQPHAYPAFEFARAQKCTRKNENAGSIYIHTEEPKHPTFNRYKRNNDMTTFLEQIRASSTNALNGIKEAAQRYTNLDFRNAILATCALVAAADGTIQDEEKAKVKKLIMGNEALSHFKAADLGAQFESYVEKALDEFAALDLERVLGKLRGKADEADMCVKIGLIIANADGVFEPSEKKVMVDIIKKLGLQPADYGL